MGKEEWKVTEWTIKSNNYKVKDRECICSESS